MRAEWTNETQDNHYLKLELYELIKNGNAIFEFLQAGSLDGIWYWDLEDPEQEWLSPRFKELFGYAVDEVPHTSQWWQEHIFAEDLELAIDNFNRHCADPKHPYDQVVRYRHKNGSTVWVRCRGLAIRDATGKPIRMLGAHTDLTALKEAEGRLALEALEANAWLAALVGSSDDAILSKTLDGTILTWNRGAEQLYGYSRAEVVGRSIQIIVPEHLYSEWQDILAKLRNGEHVERLETIRRAKSGREFPVALTICPVLGPDGVVLGASTIARDISERVAMEGQLRDKAASLETTITALKRSRRELSRANDEIQEFVYSVSHDLKAPLVTIGGFAAVLEEKLEAYDATDALGALTRLQEAAAIMGERIHAILELGEAGRPSHERTALSLQKVIEEVVAAFGPEIGHQGIDVSVASDLPTIVGDRNALSRLFQNIIGNAIDHGCVGDDRRIEIGWRQDQGHLEIDVRDHGPGVDLEDRERIFAPFFRLSSKPEGNGLGLSIAERIARGHGGNIGIVSAPGGGAVFRIRLQTAAQS